MAEVRVESRYLDAILAMIAVIEIGDPRLKLHSQRVADFAARLSRLVGQDEEFTEAVRVAGLLHDIGKLAIPAEILFAPRPLTDLEWDIVRDHPLDSAKVVGAISFPWDLQGMVLQHHERWDGKGYPHGLRGDEIAPGARILALADALEAMTADRPYSPKLPIEQVFEEVRKNLGKQFDPHYAQRFLEWPPDVIGVLSEG